MSNGPSMSCSVACSSNDCAALSSCCRRVPHTQSEDRQQLSLRGWKEMVSHTDRPYALALSLGPSPRRSREQSPLSLLCALSLRPPLNPQTAATDGIQTAKARGVRGSRERRHWHEPHGCCKKRSHNDIRWRCAPTLPHGSPREASDIRLSASKLSWAPPRAHDRARHAMRARVLL